LFITHNIGVVNRVAHRVCVLYAGRVLELGDKDAVLGAPAHPYTKGLLASLPALSVIGSERRTAPIPGRFPDLTQPSPGCIFADRCLFAEGRCRAPQELITLDGGRQVRCWKAGAGTLPAWPQSERNRRTRARGLPAAPLLQAENVVKTFRRGSLRGGIEWTRRLLVFPWPQVRTELIRAVDGITLAVGRGEAVGLVGESGSGKSTFGRTVLKLVEPNGGRILFDGVDVARQREDALLALRKRAQIVFQNPDSSLNPRRRVGDAIARAVKLHSNVPATGLRQHVETLLDHVGLPRGYYDRYPHQLSGGEKQRVGIARALATGPDFIVCDEPVSALDVSVQATILNLLDDLRGELGLSYLFISHDLAVVAYIADRIAVMYAGRICEEGEVASVLAPPHHPYTEALLSAVPQPTPRAHRSERIRLRGEATSVQVAETCCPFHPRCPRKIGTICETAIPPVLEFSRGHRIACHLPPEQLAAPQRGS
jgi:peptide/nickel transport system ATP-binding protein